MRSLIKSAVMPIFLCLVLVACGRNSSEDSSKNESPKQQPAPSQPAPQPSAAQPQAPPAAAVPAKTAPVAAKVVLPKDILILKSAPMGGVKFEHKLHAQTRNINCETCHHASKPEKPAAAPQQVCSACHTTMAAPPMKTTRQAAFHSPTAASGTCIDCHKTQNAAGKAAPVKCLDCHKKSNT